MSEFPRQRMRRLRRTAGVRRLVERTRVLPQDLICPLFVVEDRAMAGPIGLLPGVRRRYVDEVAEVAGDLWRIGIRGLLLFGIPAAKDSRASRATADDSAVAQAISAVRAGAPEMVVFTDVCVCSYTDHGHCGVLVGDDVDNDQTLSLLGDMSVTHARAGADYVAPSAMMDGQVAAIRSALDAEGLSHTGILSYAAKFASSFYGPFREAADSAPERGDRRGYQMSPCNLEEAVREAEMDVAEGADMIMVKPGMPYLDVVHACRRRLPAMPLAVYQVSGEYAMLHAAASAGAIDLDAAVDESLLAMRRAGADLVITYFAEAWCRRRGGERGTEGRA